MEAAPAATISASLVVRHEEALIERCLGSMAGVVDEIIVIHDGPCEDRTLEIAASYGARTLELPLVGHAERHRVVTYDQATSDWILRLDADEYLSGELRAQLRSLVERTDVNGYSFVWPIWDGQTYLTTDGPHRLALFRRRALHFVGHVQSIEQVDEPVLASSLRLEHQPAYNNYTLRTMRTKWRRWAQINAREYLTPLDEFPSFNVPRPLRWPARRRLLNALSPLVLPLYPFAIFAVGTRANLARFGGRQAARFALHATIYSTLVQFYVAKYRYVDRRWRR